MELGRSHSLRAEGPRMTQPHVCGVHVRAPPRTRQAGSTRLPKACGTPAGAGRELTPGAGAPRSATWGGGRKQRLTAVSPEHTLNLARPRPGHSPTSCHSKSGDRCGTGKQGSTRAADFAKKKKDEMRHRGLSYLPTPPRHGSSLRVFLSTKVLPSFPPRSSQELMSPEQEGGAVQGPDGDPGQG